MGQSTGMCEWERVAVAIWGTVLTASERFLALSEAFNAPRYFCSDFFLVESLSQSHMDSLSSSIQSSR